MIGSLDLSKYRLGTRYLTNVGFSACYDLGEIPVDSSSTYLYWKALKWWVYTPLNVKGCIDLLSIKDSCGYWVRNQMFDLRIGLWLIFDLWVCIHDWDWCWFVSCIPYIDWIWAVMWLGDWLRYYGGLFYWFVGIRLWIVASPLLRLRFLCQNIIGY